MDSTDAPPDSLRGRLLRHMTSLDSQLKRCVAEFLFLLCGEDGRSPLSFCSVTALCMSCMLI
jgi:hypothetical protein